MANRTVFCIVVFGGQHLLLVRRVAASCLTTDATCSNAAAKCLHDDG